MWLGGIRRGGWREIDRVFQVFLNRCPVQVHTPPPQQPHFTPQCKCWGQCAEWTGAVVTGDITVALGVLRHLWLLNPPWTLFGAVLSLRGAVHSLPNAGPLNSLHFIRVLFISLLLSSGFLPFSPYLKPSLSSSIPFWHSACSCFLSLWFYVSPSHLSWCQTLPDRVLSLSVLSG